MGGDAIPEMGKSVRGEVLKSRVWFWLFPVWGRDQQRDVGQGFSWKCLDSGSQGWDVDLVIIGVGWHSEPCISMISPWRVYI